jgi:hypothetical protein
MGEIADFETAREKRVQADQERQREASAIRFTLEVVDYGHEDYIDVQIVGVGDGSEPDFPFAEIADSTIKAALQIALTAHKAGRRPENLPVAAVAIYGGGGIIARIVPRLFDTDERKTWLIKTAGLIVSALRRALG